MDTQPKDDTASAIDQRNPEYLLRRSFVPKEFKTAKGTIVFRTTDDEVYARLADGSIRRAHPKANGKDARKARALARKVQVVKRAR